MFFPQAIESRLRARLVVTEMRGMRICHAVVSCASCKRDAVLPVYNSVSGEHRQSVRECNLRWKRGAASAVTWGISLTTAVVVLSTETFFHRTISDSSPRGVSSCCLLH